jgi:hydroxymethylpyrimidine pyrophosphatase-like HAD family hydrolase
VPGIVIAGTVAVKLTAIALDYDGTIATHGVMDADARAAIGTARDAGIAVILATGRRLADLQHVAKDLSCFDAVVAENGAVVDFPLRGRHSILGHTPTAAFVDELRRRGIVFDLGESLIEADAGTSASIIEAIHALQQPLVLTFNRGRVMVLPQAIGKSTGLREALTTLRLSIHNTIAIGDAENDHDLLHACEVGVAVEWGSPALLAVADDVIPGAGPAAVAGYIREMTRRGTLRAAQMGRRRMLLGQQHNGLAVSLAVRGRPVLIAGEPGSGKSWLAGLMCEQLILLGYSLCILDPEGDYASLEALPNVTVLGGDDPPPRARELTRALRHPEDSVVIDLSRVRHREKVQYLDTVMDLLVRLRQQTGLPHRIVVDEAHYLISGKGSCALAGADLSGLTLVTYRVSTIANAISLPQDAVLLVTKETDPHEIDALRALSSKPGTTISSSIFRDLQPNEAAILPGAEESGAGAKRFQVGARLTTHVRHRTKYLDMPVSDTQAFVFSVSGRPTSRARTLKEFVGLIAALPEAVLQGHLQRHDFSRWIADVFRDAALAARIRGFESRVDGEGAGDVAGTIGQAIRARYERLPSSISEVA